MARTCVGNLSSSMLPTGNRRHPPSGARSARARPASPIATAARPDRGWQGVHTSARSGNDTERQPPRARHRPPCRRDVERPVVRAGVRRRLRAPCPLPRLARQCLVADGVDARTPPPAAGPDAPGAACALEPHLDQDRPGARSHRGACRHGLHLLRPHHADGAARPPPRQGFPAPRPRSSRSHLLDRAQYPRPPRARTAPRSVLKGEFSHVPVARAVALHARAQEVLAVADLRRAGLLRRRARAGAGLGRGALHLHAVLRAERGRTPMRVLGISAFYHDSAAALVVDGDVAAAAQEERFTRKKHDARFPAHAVAYCLEHAGARLSDLDAVVFYEKPLVKFERLLETYLSFAPRGLRSFTMAMPVWLREKLFQKQVLARELRKLDPGFDGA